MKGVFKGVAWYNEEQSLCVVKTFHWYSRCNASSDFFGERNMQSVQDLSTAVQRVINNVEKVIVGKAESVSFSLIAVICNGHILIEDVPGVGKTVLTKAIAKSIGCTFKRIQFTPDLLPSDVTGVSIYNQKTSNFEFRPR